MTETAIFEKLDALKIAAQQFRIDSTAYALDE